MKRILVSLAAIAMVAVSFADFELMVAETPPGPDNQNPANWGGILRWNIDGGGMASTIPGIPSTSLNDPMGGFFTPAGEFLVSNRHGNTSGGSVNRFTRDGGGNFVANGSVSGNSMFASHGGNVNPVTGEIFVTNVSGPTSRFTFGGGVYSPNGTLNTGSGRDVTFTSDGSNAYISTGVSASIWRFDTTTNTLTNYGGVANGIHQLAWRNGELYGASFQGGSSGVYRILRDGSGAVTGTQLVQSVTDAIGLVFSPDGNEMFVSQHTNTSGNINRYIFNAGTQSWDSNGTIAVGHSLGNLTVYAVPEPATMFALAGLIPLLRRRRRKQ